MDDWKELMQDFLSEAYSLLDSLEESLLHLEKNLTDHAQIATVFRVAHTIKGGAGAMGFTEITGLTHIMEDVLDLVRNNVYLLTQDDITLLLDIRDELFKLLKARETETTHDLSHSQELIQQLNTIKTSGTSPAPVQNTNTSTSPTTTLPLAARFIIDKNQIEAFEEGLKHQERFIFIEIAFNEDYEMKEVAAFEILAIINEFAEPIVMNPSYELLDEKFYPYLNIVFTSDADIEYIQQKLQLTDVVTNVDVKILDEGLLNELKGASPSPQTPKNIPTANVEVIAPIQQNTIEESTLKEEKKNPILKIESPKIDELLNLLGELVIIRSGLGQLETDFDKSIQSINFGLRSFLSSSTLLPLNDDPEQNTLQNSLLRQAYGDLATNLDYYADFIQQFSRISGILQTKMMQLRMIPVQTVFSRFTRVTRDIAKQLGKKVELVIEGGETEIDKGIIDDLYDPLIHMIRNSLDHGLEIPEERLAAGKSETGTIYLRAYQEGDMIFIEIGDDGRGIDAEKIKTKAIEKGFITEEQASQLSTQAALQLILLPGFSTAEQISNLSGRGVGMDVVVQTFEQLGGTVGISSQIGFGSVVTIKLPLTLAIIQGLVLLVEGIHFVIPIGTVEETVIVTTEKLYPLKNYYALKFREKLIPIIDLPHLLYEKQPFYKAYETSTSINDAVYCIIVKFGSRQVGIIVPEILGEQDIVVKPMDHSLVTSPGISAATIVGNGEIGFILDIGSLVKTYLNPTTKQKETDNE